MPKQEKSQKSTITVTMSWFSSPPVFKTALSSVTREITDGRVLTGEAHEQLRKLLPLNGEQPFGGETHFGPHTTIRFEAESLSHAVSAVNALQAFFQHEFPDLGRGTGGMQVRYAGKPLAELLESLETALKDAQPDLKGTRRFLPSKHIGNLRTNFAALYS